MRGAIGLCPQKAYSVEGKPNKMVKIDLLSN